MLKNKKILISLIFLIFIIISLNTSVYADTKIIEITSINISSGDGIYRVGDEIVVNLNFSEPVKGKLPSLRFEFNRDYESRTVVDVPDAESMVETAEYRYTVKEGDNGRLSLDFLLPSILNVVKFKLADDLEYNYKIYADTTVEWLDTSNVKFKWWEMIENRPYEEMIPRFGKPSLKIEGVDFKPGNSYYIYLSKDSNERFDFINNFDLLGSDDWISIYIKSKEDAFVNSASLSEFMFRTGNTYISVAEIDYDTNIVKIILKSKKLDEIELLPLNNRIIAGFNKKDSYVFLSDYDYDQLKFNYKIGKITDKNLLNKAKNNEPGIWEELLLYAKNNPALISGTLDYGFENDAIEIGSKLVDEAYYFLYTELDTENGKYIEIEDIDLLQFRDFSLIGRGWHLIVFQITNLIGI